MQGDGAEGRTAGGFHPTCWTMVQAAGDSAEALEQLCRAYWPPVHAHLRRQGMDLHQAQDLTQEFFARLLGGNPFASVSRDRGRFRSYLLAALKHFLINEWKRERTQKRGGGQVLVALDALQEASRDALAPSDGDTPDRAFERRWALTVLDRVRERMKTEYAAAGQMDRYEGLKGYLLDGREPSSYAETAAALGLSEAAVKSAVYKIRQRFGAMLRAEIARTVAGPEEVEDEIRCLLAALR